MECLLINTHIQQLNISLHFSSLLLSIKTQKQYIISTKQLIQIFSTYSISTSIWPPGGTTCIGWKFSHQVTPLVIFVNLASWCHLRAIYKEAILNCHGRAYGRALRGEKKRAKPETVIYPNFFPLVFRKNSSRCGGGGVTPQSVNFFC